MLWSLPWFPIVLGQNLYLSPTLDTSHPQPSPSLYLPPLSHLYFRTFLHAVLSALLALISSFPDGLQYSPFSVPWESESQSCSVVSDSLQAHGLYNPWNSPGQNTGVGSLSLLQGIFSIQGLNPGLPNCRRILYQVSHKESPRISEWVAYPFSSRSSDPGIDSLSAELAGKLPSNHWLQAVISLWF